MGFNSLSKAGFFPAQTALIHLQDHPGGKQTLTIDSQELKATLKRDHVPVEAPAVRAAHPRIGLEKMDRST